MKSSETNKSLNKVVAKTIVNALIEKKEIKLRLQNGEDLKKIGKEKGFKVVLPL